jgi:hypothetical protein
MRHLTYRNFGLTLLDGGDPPLTGTGGSGPWRCVACEKPISAAQGAVCLYGDHFHRDCACLRRTELGPPLTQ